MQRVGDRVEVSGAMTFAGARALLERGSDMLREGGRVFDLAAVAEVDSSGLAVVFGWSRAAAAAGQTLRIVNPPANLISLAELYGVTELLPL
jgi:phospholipid transport system transporter-binding protein